MKKQVAMTLSNDEISQEILSTSIKSDEKSGADYMKEAFGNKSIKTHLVSNSEADINDSNTNGLEGDVLNNDPNTDSFSESGSQAGSDSDDDEDIFHGMRVSISLWVMVR